MSFNKFLMSIMFTTEKTTKFISKLSGFEILNKSFINRILLFFSIYLKTRYSLINKACGRRKDSVKVVQQQKDLMDLST